MEMNLNEMRLALEGLNRLDTTITIEPEVDQIGYKMQWERKDAISALQNKLFFEIKRLENEEALNNPDEITKMMLALEKK